MHYQHSGCLIFEPIRSCTLFLPRVLPNGNSSNQLKIDVLSLKNAAMLYGYQDFVVVTLTAWPV